MTCFFWVPKVRKYDKGYPYTLPLMKEDMPWSLEKFPIYDIYT